TLICSAHLISSIQEAFLWRFPRDFPPGKPGLRPPAALWHSRWAPVPYGSGTNPVPAPSPPYTRVPPPHHPRRCPGMPLPLPSPWQKQLRSEHCRLGRWSSYGGTYRRHYRQFQEPLSCIFTHLYLLFFNVLFCYIIFAPINQVFIRIHLSKF